MLTELEPGREITYVGSFDDYDDRLWSQGSPLEKVLHANNRLIGSVLFDSQIVINDAWLPLNPVFHNSLFDTELSPLRRLVDCGHLKILSRTEGELGSLLKKMVETIGVPPHIQEKASNTRLIDELELWSGKLKDNGAFIPFPTKDLTEGYSTLAAQLVQPGGRDVPL